MIYSLDPLMREFQTYKSPHHSTTSFINLAGVLISNFDTLIVQSEQNYNTLCYHIHSTVQIANRAGTTGSLTRVDLAIDTIPERKKAHLTRTVHKAAVVGVNDDPTIELVDEFWWLGISMLPHHATHIRKSDDDLYSRVSLFAHH